MGTRLYVGNLTFSTTEDRLRALFEQTGAQVNTVHMVTDRDTGRPRGFAFVEVSDASQATGAIEQLNGANVDGRTLTVNEAREREGGRGGGGGGGGGGGFRNRY
jgi:RNA recognition motif-containing protein